MEQKRYKPEVKIVKKKRFNIARTLVLVLFIYLLVCIGLYLYNEPVRHYEIIGNSFVSDADILRDTGLSKYPSYLSVSTSKIKKKLKNNKLIKSIKVKHKWNFVIEIEIEENAPVFINKSDNKIVLSDGTMIENDNSIIGIPLLLNETPEKELKLLANKLSEIDRGILFMISEIEYKPSYNSNEQIIDSHRFLLSMSDNNLVYITSKKAKLLNKYLDVIATDSIKGAGTLYLDGDEDRYSFALFNNGGIQDEN